MDLLASAAPAPLVDALRRADAEQSRALLGLLEAAGAMARACPARLEPFLQCEVALALRQSEVTAARLLAHARTLSVLPAVRELLGQGRLPAAHARLLLERLGGLCADTAAAVEQAVLPAGCEMSLAELRRPVERAVLAVDVAAAERRRARARSTRGVWIQAEDDGMARLVVLTTAEKAVAALASIDTLVWPRQAGDERTAEQRRSDAAIDLLTGGVDGPGRWTAAVLVPVTTALNAAGSAGAQPAELPGYGPITPDAARALLPVADLLRLAVDARSSEVLTADNRSCRPVRRACRNGNATGTADGTETDSGSGRRATPAGEETSHFRVGPRAWSAAELRERLRTFATTPARTDLTALATDGYRVPEPLRRLVELRDLTCTFPGCTISARRCDQDHRTPWPLGPTNADNLDALSKRHHLAKHTGYRVRKLPDGTRQWSTPWGQTYWRPPPLAPPRASTS